MADAVKDLKEKGNGRFKVGDYSGACEFYQKAIDFARTDHVLHSNMAQANIKIRQWAVAWVHANECTTLKPDYWKGWGRLAKASFHANNFEDVADAASRAIALEPGCKDDLAQLVKDAATVEAAAKLLMGNPAVQPSAAARELVRKAAGHGGYNRGRTNDFGSDSEDGEVAGLVPQTDASLLFHYLVEYGKTRKRYTKMYAKVAAALGRMVGRGRGPLLIALWPRGDDISLEEPDGEDCESDVGEDDYLDGYADLIMGDFEYAFPFLLDMVNGSHTRYGTENSDPMERLWFRGQACRLLELATRPKPKGDDDLLAGLLLATPQVWSRKLTPAMRTDLEDTIVLYSGLLDKEMARIVRDHSKGGRWPRFAASIVMQAESPEAGRDGLLITTRLAQMAMNIKSTTLLPHIRRMMMLDKVDVLVVGSWSKVLEAFGCKWLLLENPIDRDLDIRTQIILEGRKLFYDQGTVRGERNKVDLMASPKCSSLICNTISTSRAPHPVVCSCNRAHFCSMDCYYTHKKLCAVAMSGEPPKTSNGSQTLPKSSSAKSCGNCLQPEAWPGQFTTPPCGCPGRHQFCSEPCRLYVRTMVLSPHAGCCSAPNTKSTSTEYGSDS